MSTLKNAVKQCCLGNDIRLNKDLGQHFLIDQDVLDAITKAANIQEDDQIIEIGPGVGVLTLELVRRSKNVTCIEIDKRFPPVIRTYILMHDTTLPMPTIIEDNALNVPFPTSPYKIVANIPYHITSPLLRHAFLEGSAPPTSLTLLIQREVAEKICDPDDAGLLTIIVGLFGTPKIVRHVPPSCFLPPPKVDSSVLHIDCFPKPTVPPETIETIIKLAKHAFSQKRKMLRNTIVQLEGGADALTAANIEPTRRPQTLSIDEWVALAQAFTA